MTNGKAGFGGEMGCSICTYLHLFALDCAICGYLRLFQGDFFELNFQIFKLSRLRMGPKSSGFQYGNAEQEQIKIRIKIKNRGTDAVETTFRFGRRDFSALEIFAPLLIIYTDTYRGTQEGNASVTN